MYIHVYIKCLQLLITAFRTDSIILHHFIIVDTFIIF